MLISQCSPRPILEPCGLPGIEFQVDTYVGCEHYCYYCYALNQAETDWSREISLHEDLGGQLRGELKAVPPQKIYLGYKTDPYQPSEAEYGQTRQALELLVQLGFSASVLTKSGLMARDIDLYSQMPESNVSISVAFADDSERRLFEHNTVPTAERVAALGRIKAAGISTSALLCPVIPHITRVEPLLDMLAPVAGKIWIYGLSINETSEPNWQMVKAILDTHYPAYSAQIQKIVFDHDHPYWAELRQKLLALQAEKQLNLEIHL
jgi:DNA repair photolyase